MTKKKTLVIAILCSLAGTSTATNATSLQGFQTNQIHRHAVNAVNGATLADDSTEQTDDDDSEELRIQAIAALAEAISLAEQMQATIQLAPQASKTALQVAISTAKTMKATLDRGGILANLISTSSIEEATHTLTDFVQQMPALSQYYQGALEEIDCNETISSATSLKTIVTAARAGVELVTTTSALQNVLSTMHLAVAGYLQGVDSLAQGQNLSGLIPNHSFDRGCMDEWYGLNIDLQGIDLANFRLDNLASLAGAIQFGMRDGTQAVLNASSDSIPAVHGNYYLYSNNTGAVPGQPIATMLTALPGGSYQLSARMAVAPGFLHLYNNHLTVLTVPFEVLKQVIEGVDFSTTDITQIISNINLSELLPALLQNGKIITAKGSGSGINTLDDVSLSFDIAKNDFVLIVMNAGVVPLVGTSAYKADNLQLTYLHAPIDEDPSGEEDGLSDIDVRPALHNSYDLSGRTADFRHKGIRIKNGKKYVGR